MKKVLLLLAAAAFTFAACDPKDPEQPDDPTPVDPEPIVDPVNPEEEEELDPEVKNGDTICVTNALVEQFLTEVQYPDHDYSYTRITDYKPSSPGRADIPAAFTIRWTADATAGELEARLWEDDGWSRDYTIDAGEHYLRITNLRPNANYHYYVKAAGKTMTEGSFKTTGHLHQIMFKSRVRNARDLGGWKTSEGKTVKYRKVYRGGRLESGTLTKTGIKDAIAEGIRAQLDLRGHTSSGNQEYLNHNALDSSYPFLAPCIEEGYTDMLTTFKEQTRQCFEFVVQCVRDNNPVYFHCSLGRDRTGTLSMLLLGVLGVPEGDISQEYEITQFAPHGWATSDGEKTKMTRRVDYKGAATYIWNNFAGAGTFQQGVEAYLLSIGVPQKDIDDFRSLMLE